ncbi:YqaJ viral recombinase family protein [Ruminiclostridium josui]|uniref:YqaJ viral recombinase family nuclease n=1 Tax=Ruminiclostridium josui TaxID=1499 RepID=UPI000464B92A|nr:YqaJ viral recombinase family protein [Ruminiclostridium josui]
MNTETIMKNVNILADVNTLTNEDWLKIRKTGVGGSEIAALFGKSNYASPLSVYMDKMSNQINEIENEFIEWGKTLEPIIREKFPKKFWSTTGYQIDVEEFSYMMQSKENPYMLANIDGLLAPINDYKFNVQVAEGEWEECFIPAGQLGGLEIKTGSGFTAKNWRENTLPDNYFLQTQHYMAVTGLPYFFVVALIDKHLLWRYIPRNEEIIAIIKNRVHEFWTENILKKNPPAPIGSEVDTGILKSMYPQELKDKALNLDHMADKRIRYKELSEEIKGLQKEQEAIKQEFMSAMGDAELAFVGDKKISWKMQAGSTYTVTRKPQRVLRIG